MTTRNRQLDNSSLYTRVIEGVRPTRSDVSRDRTARAAAWYTAAYRRHAAASELESGAWYTSVLPDFAAADAQWSAYDRRAAIAARYARLASR